MSKFLSERRVLIAALSICASAAIYMTFSNGRQLAQQKVGQSAFAKFAVSDLVTNDVRSDSMEISRVRVNGREDRLNISKYGRIVGDYGSFVVIAKRKGTDLSQTGLENQLIDTTINLPGAKFEPISDPPSGTVEAGRLEAAGGKGYYILQFGGTVTDEWLDSIRDAGVEILQYVPHQAYFVYGEGAAIAKAAGHSRVRWVGSYTAGQKLTTVMREQIESAKNRTALRSEYSPLELTEKGTAFFDVAVFARADVNAVAGRIRNSFSKAPGHVSRLPNNFFNVIRMELKLDDVEAVAAIPDVVSIEAYIKPRREDERSSHIVAGNYTSPTSISGPGYDPNAQFGVDGTGVTVSVVDDGIGIPGDGNFYITSANAVDGPLRGATTGALGHGHLSATIIAGSAPFSLLDPSGYSYGLGVAPGTHVVNIPLLRSGYQAGSVNHSLIYDDSVTTPGPNGVVSSISNNSWGSGTNGNLYTSFAAQFDGFVRDASFAATIDPISIIFSAGNNGSLGLTQPKVAKNVIAVASAENLRTELSGFNANNIDDLSNASARGPASDGRIKPDISAPGSGISGGRSGTDALFGNIDAHHRWSSGTSHAAPQIAGVAALFTQYWTATRFGDRPSPALVKAAIINSGQDMNGNLSGAAKPNGNEGWGRVNTKLILDAGVGIKSIDEEIQLEAAGTSQGFVGSVDDSTKPVRISLVWTDPPGVTNPALVNNLDLTVTIGANVYRGNVFANGVSITGGAADTLNNVENVFLPAGIPAGTPYSVSVTAAALNGDGILGNADFTDQNYAVVAYNFSPQVASGPFTLSGVITSLSGRGVPNAVVTITDSEGSTTQRLTNHFGYYTFAGVLGGQAHTISISSKRYTFLPQTITVNNNLTGINFTATNGSP